MKLMQRFGECNNPEYVKSYTEAMKKYPGSVDEVWLPTYYGFHSLEKHEEYAEKLAEIAKNLRKDGIGVSMQMSNTIGHGSKPKDGSGLIFEGSPVKRLTGHDGAVAEYCFCWRNHFFRDYLTAVAEIYVKRVQPRCIWVDDDFRARNHGVVQYGCFCDDCLKEFNQRHRSSFSREALVEELLHGELLWRERWIQFLREGLRDLMLAIAKAVHRVSPKTRMALQHGSYGAYTGHGLEYIFDAMKEGTGYNPSTRPGGGSYRDHDPENFIHKGEVISWQNSMLPDYVEEICPEIENTPFVVFGKTPAGTAFEASHYFACGSTGMSFSMIMRANEPMAWHEKEFALFAKHRQYWEKMAEYNKNSYQAGLQNFVSKESWKRKLTSEQGIEDWSREPYSEAWPWLRDAIPISYDKEEETVFLLHPECAKDISDEELEMLLKKPVLTDGETIAMLAKRGVDFGVTATEVPAGVPLQEIMTTPPKNGAPKEYLVGVYTTGGGRNQKYYLLPNGEEGINVLAEYATTVPREGYTGDSQYPYGIADAIITTPKGAKWAVFGYTPWKGVMSFAKREQILDAADEICNQGLAARLLTPFPGVLQPRKNREGKVVCISITSCTIGESGELELLIRNPAGERMTYHSQHNGSGELKVEKKEDGYHVIIPDLHPWSVLTVFVEE